jgi:predicted alpha/beta hydrolase
MPEGEVTRAIDVRKVTVPARDGQALAATLFLPQGEPERVVIVAAATAVRQSFYEPFARYLASSGCAAMTFDYRGIGQSRKGAVAEVDATIRDWGEKDYSAIVDYAASEFPGKTLQVVGHSVGGQLVGMLDNANRIDAVCTVAAQHGYWRLYPWRQAVTYALLWYVVMPLVTWLFAYFPAKRLRLGEDLPKGVAFEWARFARSPHYFVAPDGAPIRRGFDVFDGPVLAYSFEDDVRAPPSCVAALHALFARAQVEHRRIDPTTLEARAIGHVGFFFAKFKHSLWRDSLEWLRAH